MTGLFKLILVAATIVAIGWPLTFWGYPASPKTKAVHDVEQPWPHHPYTISPTHELLW
jgi:hypothetical protein